VRAEHWRVKQLFQSALERASDERAAYLHEACAGDEALRQEVESLLSREKGLDGFLEAPALQAVAKMFSENASQALIGRQMSSYQVLSQLGAGAMGEVYKAYDTRLGRDVAIKVLPPAFVHDPERLSRFQREAKMLAALNHPNIATIHGLEESDGVHYLVMELVSGLTLAEELKNGPLRTEEGLKIAAQIAGALEAAHERGVIHRDLKPANVKVTPEGRVKVLDFGLAKAFAADSGLSLSNAPMVTAMGTEEGRILGTQAYMSPEQVRGKPLDKRTDIWALGCVLYELLTARRAFAGETLSDTAAAILEREPDWQALPTSTPVKIRDLLRRCLQKDKALRMQAAGDIRIEIHEALAAPPAESKADVLNQPAAGWRRVAVLGLAGMALLAVGVIATWNLKPSPARPVSRLVINLPPGQRLAGLDAGPVVALSPDGTHLAYVANQGGTQRLYLRAMDGLEPKPMPGTEGAIDPFFSPDGQWLGFFASGKLKKVSVNGGTALTIADVASLAGASWSSEGMVAFAPTGDSFLQLVSDAGGTPQPLTRFEKGEFAHRWPEFLPGDKALLFAASTNLNNAQIAVQRVGTGERRNLVQGATQPRYAPSGHLIYAQAGNLMAAPFDPRRLAVTGTAVPVVEGVLQFPASGDAQYSLSATGSLVYVPGSVQGAQRKLVWVSHNGAEQPLAAPVRAYLNPRLSPDSRKVAVGIVSQQQDSQVWLYDLSRETLTRLTFEGRNNNNPVWTPDGKRVAFNSGREGPSNIFWQLADGSGGLERLTTGAYVQSPHSWSPDGRFLAFIEVNPSTGVDIWVLPLSDRKVQPFLRTQFTEGAPRFSPDGRWLAYVSDESGRFEVYVQLYPGPGGKWQISTEGGDEPVWNPSGRELFYRSGERMMAVDIATQPSFTAGKPRLLFKGQYVPTATTPANYDVSPDGQRFLMLKSEEQSSFSAPTQIVVVQNWFEELKRRVPAGK
jgi:Tol biopolymer transport system component/tRNA A-37 threonylcarbamoyl transferase component Bud32